MALRSDYYTPLVETSDDQLVARFHDGDGDALAVLLERYRRFARAKARGYFLVGGDSDDIEQEGMIGLYKAARDFRPEQGRVPGADERHAPVNGGDALHS